MKKASKNDLRHVQDKTKYNDENMPDVIKYFMLDERKIGNSDNTIKNYVCDITLCLQFLKSLKRPTKREIKEITLKGINEKFLDSVTYNDLDKFTSYLLGMGNSKKTLARRISSVKMFFKFLKKQGYVKNNPSENLEHPKLDTTKHPAYLQMDEVERLLQTIKESKNEYVIRDYAIVTLFINTGMRLSELISINRESIKNDIILIIGKGNKERTIYLNKTSLNVIDAYLKVRPEIPGEDALFVSERSKRIDKRTVEDLVKKYLAAAGFDTNKYHVHSLRATFCTLMHKKGVPITEIQEMVGHESIITTRHYTSIEQENLRQAANVLNIG